MHTFLTPDPVTLEIRNAAGDIHVVLTDTRTTTVDVIPVTSHPLGFLDDVLKAFGGGRGRQLANRLGGTFGDRAPFGETGSEPGWAQAGSDESTSSDVADLVRVTHSDTDNPVVMVDTDPARDGWRSGFTVTITAPTGSNIRVQSQSASVTLTGAAELVDIRTASGGVKVDEARGKTLVQTASGDVSVAIAGAQLDVRTASGDVEAGSVGGDALIHTTSGGIRLGAVAGNISARSVSGDVRVADAAAGQAEVNAVSGDVEIGVHAGSLASINLSTVSGSTDTDFDIIGEAPEGDSPVLAITVKTTSGDIRLHHAAA